MTDNEMTTTSIYIRKDLLRRLKNAAGQVGVSIIVSKLCEKWLDKKVEISIEPNDPN